MNIYIPLLLTIALFACAQQANRPLDEDQKKQIQHEIQSAIGNIREAAANVDTTKLYESFSFAPDEFTYVETSGAFYDEAAYKKMVREFYLPLATEIIEKGTEKYTYLSSDNVLWSYSGTLSATYKNGQQVRYAPFGMTMLFRKFNDKWKVVFLQESTQEPAQTDSTKHGG